MQAGLISNSWHWYIPISSIAADILFFFNFSDLTINLINQTCWWSHLVIFLGFAVYIPNSKHMHLVAAGPNIYFRHFDTIGKPKTIDFENDEIFGVSKVTQFSWKGLLDTFACTECGRCDAVCPATLTKKPLQPQKVLLDIKENLRYKNWNEIKKYRDKWGNINEKDKEKEIEFSPKTSLISREKITANDTSKVFESGKYKIDGQIHIDEIWACTSCGACIDACPVLIDSVPNNLIQLRQNLVMMEAQDYPKELNTAFKGLENQSNPWGMGADKREEWCDGLDVPKIYENKDKEVEYLFWVGCAGATDDKAKKVQKALVKNFKSSKC